MSMSPNRKTWGAAALLTVIGIGCQAAPMPSKRVDAARQTGARAAAEHWLSIKREGVSRYGAGMEGQGAQGQATH